ncbi:hypothetical protein CEXT_6461 [Caerostris extrusa]|uniref:Uncharacterized protein n=1 Tax=Caerostris extrusa TaxID=172846 RepID=A0AAV4U4V1_CAEEX|nr:hypothetical protein CEXT_6461 [Caerostris extrusa]
MGFPIGAADTAFSRVPTHWIFELRESTTNEAKSKASLFFDEEGRHKFPSVGLAKISSLIEILVVASLFHRWRESIHLKRRADGTHSKRELVSTTMRTGTGEPRLLALRPGSESEGLDVHVLYENEDSNRFLNEGFHVLRKLSVLLSL